MRITVISMIKNAADVIETFIRGNAMFADNFVIINNGSTDRSLEILKKLSEEGYQIDIYHDNENAYLQSMKMNILIKRTMEQYDPDWIVPLDDDEILFSNITGKTVRNYFENLDEQFLYYVKWRNYLPSEDDNEGEVCVLKRQKICFSSSHETLSKVILSRYILKKNVLIMQGNHDVVNCDAERVLLVDLQIAHYPVRSNNQIISKALVGWTNILAMPNNSLNNGWHWKVIYEKVKEGKKLSIEDLWTICMLYIEDSDKREIEIEQSPIKIDENATQIKYTTINEIDPWLNYINNVEQLAHNYKDLKENKDSK